MNYPINTQNRGNIQNNETGKLAQNERRQITLPYIPMSPYRTFGIQSIQPSINQTNYAMSQNQNQNVGINFAPNIAHIGAAQYIKNLQASLVQHQNICRTYGQYLAKFQMAIEHNGYELSYLRSMCQNLLSQRNRYLQQSQNAFFNNSLPGLSNHHNFQIPTTVNNSATVNDPVMVSNPATLTVNHQTTMQNLTAMQDKKMMKNQSTRPSQGNKMNSPAHIQNQGRKSEICLQKAQKQVKIRNKFISQQKQKKAKQHESNEKKRHKQVQTVRQKKAIAVEKEQSDYKNIQQIQQQSIKKQYQQFRYYPKIQHPQEGLKQYRKKLRDRQIKKYKTDPRQKIHRNQQIPKIQPGNTENCYKQQGQQKQFGRDQHLMKPKAPKKVREKTQRKDNGSLPPHVKSNSEYFQKNEKNTVDFQHLKSLYKKEHSKEEHKEVENVDSIRLTSKIKGIVTSRKQFLEDSASQISEEGKIDMSNIPRNSILKPLMEEQKLNRHSIETKQKQALLIQKLGTPEISIEPKQIKQSQKSQRRNEVQDQQQKIESKIQFEDKKITLKCSQINKQMDKSMGKETIGGYKQEELIQDLREIPQTGQHKNKNQQSKVKLQLTSIKTYPANQLQEQKSKQNVSFLMQQNRDTINVKPPQDHANFQHHQELLINEELAFQIFQYHEDASQKQHPYNHSSRALKDNDPNLMNQLQCLPEIMINYKIEQKVDPIKLKEQSQPKLENFKIEQTIQHTNKIRILKKNMQTYNHHNQNRQNNNQAHQDNSGAHQGSSEAKQGGVEGQQGNVKQQKDQCEDIENLKDQSNAQNILKKPIVVHFDHENLIRKNAIAEKFEKQKKKKHIKIKVPCHKDDTFLIIKNWRQYDKYSNYGVTFQEEYQVQPLKMQENQKYDKEFTYNISKKVKKSRKVRGKYKKRKPTTQSPQGEDWIQIPLKPVDNSESLQSIQPALSSEAYINHAEIDQECI